MKPTYEELAQLVAHMGSDSFDWYAPDDAIVKCVYDAAERLEATHE